MSMKLRRMVQNALDIAFELADEILVDATFYKLTGWTFTLSTGEEVATVSTASVRAIEVAYQVHESNSGNVLYGDKKLVVKASELAAISPAPDAGDWFFIGDVRYDVRVANLDPTGKVWIFQTRTTVIGLTITQEDTSENWGNLAFARDSADWGNLTTETSSEDWVR